MKRILGMVFLLIGLTASAQIHNISSEVLNPLDKKIKPFMAIDSHFGFVLGREIVPLSDGANHPMIYFVQDKLSLTQRVMELYSYEPESDYEWLLEDNAQENDVFFARSRFVVDNARTKWIVMVDGSHVVFQNAATKVYVAVNEEGDIVPVEHFQDASRWKLVHVL
ncbi:MAG: hypothetical protein PF694_03805 [Bacteroidetes bacterium]|jgi:hypothetical protein|nr:hypothetical protein [Bacteroidota bacterium]